MKFSSAPNLITVTPPSWRFDLKIEEDLIEEVIRVRGYDTLGSAAPRAALAPLVASESRRTCARLRRDIAALGYQETINFSFVEERWEHELAGNLQPIRVLNPIASPLSVMRSSLLGSLINVLRYNLARRSDRVRIFELGRAYIRNPAIQDDDTHVAGIAQPLRLAGLVYGGVDELQWGARERAADFFDVKGDIEALFAPRVLRFIAAPHPALHPGRSARIELDGRTVGHAGELHPKWRQAYELPAATVLFELDAVALLEPQPAQVRATGLASSRSGATCRSSSARLLRTTCWFKPLPPQVRHWYARRDCSTSTSRRARAPKLLPGNAAWRFDSSCATTRSR